MGYASHLHRGAPPICTAKTFEKVLVVGVTGMLPILCVVFSFSLCGNAHFLNYSLSGSSTVLDVPASSAPKAGGFVGRPVEFARAHLDEACLHAAVQRGYGPA